MVYKFEMNISWDLVDRLGVIDRYDAGWKSVERKEGQSLKHLKSMATVESVGASTRIEGARMSDRDVDDFLKVMDIAQVQDQDEQEVVGYHLSLETICASHKNIHIKESFIKSLHNELLRHVEKDQWHKGDYKKQPNSVEAILEDGNKEVIFETTRPGLETEDAMRKLLDWYGKQSNVHPLIKVAVLVYEFVTIHPFQDGNGRMSRLLSTLLLLQRGYNWIQYVSFEHEIENRKGEYYAVLRSCQAQRPGEDIEVWLTFFLSCLVQLTRKLSKKIEKTSSASEMTLRMKRIFRLIERHPGIQAARLIKLAAMPASTTKLMLSKLVKTGAIEKHGVGRGTNYTVS